MGVAIPGTPSRTTIGVDVHHHAVRIRVRGDLDACAAPRLEHVLADTIGEVAADPRTDVTRMTIDLEDVDVLAAAGITVLLRAGDLAARLGIVCAVHVNPRGRRTLALTGLDRVLLPIPRQRDREQSAVSPTAPAPSPGRVRPGR